jgi:tRNA(Arg) A34 adenosine deaminase TadA
MHLHDVRDIVLKKMYFRIAREEMLLSEHETRVGACLVFNKGRIFQGHNYVNKTHPLIALHYPEFVQSIHAEVVALTSYNEVRFGPIPKSAKMYVYREDRNGFMKRAKPCRYCQHILKMFGVRKIFYSTESGFEICFL